jgi:glycosyltransferase involved in cell wall biosynthesis
VKIMVVTPYLPHRRVGHGGGTAVRDLVTWLARRHEVLVASFERPGEDGLASEVAELGARVATWPFRDARTAGPARLLLAGDRLRALLRARRSGFPHYVEKYHSPAAERWLAGLVREFAPDAVQFEYLQLALFCRGLRARRGAARTPRLVLNSHELGSLPRERRAAAAAGLARRRAAAEAAAWRRLQVAASGWADRTLCVTEQDRELYAAMGGRNLLTVPLGMDTEALVPVWAPPAAGPGEFLFVGSFQHRPNRLAATELVDRVWPALRPRLPGAVLLLAGRGSRRFLAGTDAAAAGDIRALGFVDDLTDLFRRCRLFLAPLPEGGGIKIKILEAMARGIPVVTTPVGAEGIAAADDDVLAIAEPGAAFVAAVADAVARPAACRARARRARERIEAHFSWDAITARLTEIYQGG